MVLYTFFTMYLYSHNWLLRYEEYRTKSLNTFYIEGIFKQFFLKFQLLKKLSFLLQENNLYNYYY